MQRLELLSAQLVICLLVLPVEGLCKERVVKKILAHIALKVKKKKKRKKVAFSPLGVHSPISMFSRPRATSERNKISR